MRMRLVFLTWFIFVSCTQAISNSGLHTNLSSDKRGLNSSINYVQTQPPFGSYGSKDEEMIYASIKKGHGGGKGAGGGSNVDHRPTRSGSSTPPLLSWSSTMCVTLPVMIFSIHKTRI